MLLASYMAGYQHSMCVGRSRCCRVHAHACDMKLFRVLPLPKPFTGSDLWVSTQNRGLWLVSSKTEEDMDGLCERGLTVEADRRLWKTPLLSRRTRKRSLLYPRKRSRSSTEFVKNPNSRRRSLMQQLAII